MLHFTGKWKRSRCLLVEVRDSQRKLNMGGGTPAARKHHRPQFSPGALPPVSGSPVNESRLSSGF